MEGGGSLRLSCGNPFPLTKGEASGMLTPVRLSGVSAKPFLRGRGYQGEIIRKRSSPKPFAVTAPNKKAKEKPDGLSVL